MLNSPGKLQVLWPCLHYAVPDAPKSKTFYESKSYAQYKAVNQLFADAIVANYEDGDISEPSHTHPFGRLFTFAISMGKRLPSDASSPTRPRKNPVSNNRFLPPRSLPFL